MIRTLPRPTSSVLVLVLVASLGLACGGGSSGSGDAPFDTLALDGAGDPGDATSGAPDAPVFDAAPVVLTSGFTFTPALGSLCGAGFDHVTEWLWLHPCNSVNVNAFDGAGTAEGTIARPGESANDVDLTFAPGAILIGVNAVAEGSMLFINGETGVADVHLPEAVASTPLATAFGDSHVVGGAYHVARASLFVVQDKVSATNPNTIAELDPITGAVLGMWSTLPAVDVNFGDVEVCQATGNLFVISSDDPSLTELTPTGALVAKHPLPVGVGTLSGLGLAPGGQAWVSGTDGGVWRLEGLPCP